ncbi:MAG TPA: FtsX-like permease family protein, partial [Verrucomicrobiae bacterium]|nr:FtsX-like permease family protein [Verrucomicrobiae bacterium]
MSRRRWLVHLVIGALGHRKGRTALLLAVLTMASSLATALGIVSFSMEKRVAEEVRKYGANLVILPESARIDVGSGGLNFGAVSETAYLQQRQVDDALARAGLSAERSFHLRGAVRYGNGDIPAEGVDFAQVRKLFPWWQVAGQWPSTGDVVVGVDLAARLGIKGGDYLDLHAGAGSVRYRVSGTVSSCGEEDGLLFLSLPDLQQITGLGGQATLVRLLVRTGDRSLMHRASELQALLPGAQVKEVRQIARTSEGLLAKVKLLMILVTVVVLVSAGSSVAGTMSTVVLERSKEIGLIKAMGGTRREVVVIFSCEAAL